MNKSGNNIVFKYIFIPLLLILVIILSFYFPKHLYKNRPVLPGIMIVEGWLPDYALEKSIEEFNGGGHKLMVTTGTKVPDAFRIHSLGSFIFSLGNSRLTNSDEAVKEITVNARGTFAAGEYPHFFLYINDTLTGETYVTGKSREFVFKISAMPGDIQTVRIEYDNDGYTKWKDRDLYLEYIRINDNRIPAYSRMAFYDMNRPGDYRQYSPGFNNSADYTAFILSCMGFTDSIKAIPVLNTKFSRTYSCAMAFKEWYRESSFKDTPVNIVSLGPHSLRTWKIYKTVLGKKVDTGIISVNNRGYDAKNWWKSLAGIKDTIHEMASYIYTLAVLPVLNY